ncbi:MAG: TonB family protein [Pseudomonadota bacterium]
MTFSLAPELDDATTSLEKLRAKFGPLAMVLFAHVVLFYVIYSGTLTRMVDAVTPDAVMVSFVEPPEKTAPLVKPKTVPLAQLTPPVLPSVPVPVVQLAPPPNVVSVTQAPPPAEKAPATPAVVSTAPAPASGTPKTITAGMEYILPLQTVYPPLSKRMGEQGKVMLRILVDENGKPGQVQVQSSSGFSRLDEAGRQAGLRVQFKPHMEDGRAVPVYVIIPVNFQLTT